MNSSLTLFIDTSDMNTAKIAIETDGKRYEKTSQSRLMKSQMVLPLIEELLEEKAHTLSDITAIMVATGPGSFTGLRVGIAIANALGRLLEVTVNGKKTLVTPTY
jgi:tRNA threonylcarbamoyladenosine biosynthesis protein TsaB